MWKTTFYCFEKNVISPNCLYVRKVKAFFRGNLSTSGYRSSLLRHYLKWRGVPLSLSVSHRVSSPTPSPTPSSEPSMKEPETRASSPRWCSLVLVNGLVDVYYFHVNGSIGIVQKIDFEIRPDLWCTTPKTSRKVVLDNPSVCVSVCLSVCPSVCLSVCLAVCLSCCRFFRELSQA